jgi:hypothetical protein
LWPFGKVAVLLGIVASATTARSYPVIGHLPGTG